MIWSASVERPSTEYGSAEALLAAAGPSTPESAKNKAHVGLGFLAHGTVYGLAADTAQWKVVSGPKTEEERRRDMGTISRIADFAEVTLASTTTLKGAERCAITAALWPLQSGSHKRIRLAAEGDGHLAHPMFPAPAALAANLAAAVVDTIAAIGTPLAQAPAPVEQVAATGGEPAAGGELGTAITGEPHDGVGDVGGAAVTTPEGSDDNDDALLD